MTVPLGQGGQLDLSWMPEEQRNALVTDYAKGILDTSRKANELGLEVTTLRSTLGSLADNAKQMSADGLSVTATHTHNSQFGRTEVIVGNTETAGKGKLSRSQTGERDWTPYYIFAGLAALVLIAIVLAGGK
jgi:hypothetical protein